MILAPARQSWPAFLSKSWIARGTCSVACSLPGQSGEQWQDELYRRFQLPFDILTNDKLEAALQALVSENNLIIARLDKNLRNEDVQQNSKP